MERSPTPAQIRKFTRADVARMLEAGVLNEGERTELLDGVLIVPPAEGPLHTTLAIALSRTMRRVYPEGAYTVRENHPLVVSDLSEPQPDIAVVPGNETTFSARHPRGDEAILVIEIAQSTLRDDRLKLRSYAEAGVPVVWILDVQSKRFEVYAHPIIAEERYATVDATTRVTFPGTQAVILIADLLP